MQYSTYLLVHS